MAAPLLMTLPLLTMLAGTWLPLVMVVLCATVTPLPL